MMKKVTHACLGSIWYPSEPSDVPYSPNQFLGWDFFAAVTYSMTAVETSTTCNFLTINQKDIIGR